MLKCESKKYFKYFQKVLDKSAPQAYNNNCREEVINMKRNSYKTNTFEDKFARKFYCEHARLNSIRNDKKEQHKKFRRDFKKSLDKYIDE